jgi:thioredoxin 1
MATVDLTEDTFEATITGHDLVVVDWWAPWCGPCHVFAPVFEAASRRHDDVVFAKVDTQANRALATAAGIRSIPTLMVFRQHRLVRTRTGTLPGPALDALLDEVRALDPSPAGDVGDRPPYGVGDGRPHPPRAAVQMEEEP